MLVLSFSETLLDEPRLRVLVHLVRGMIMAALGPELVKVRLAAHLMRDIIGGHQRSSELVKVRLAAHLMRDIIGSHQRSSELVKVRLAAHRAGGARHGALERLLELHDHVAASGLDAVTDSLRALNPLFADKGRPIQRRRTDGFGAIKYIERIA
jgi:hypothetical protein